MFFTTKSPQAHLFPTQAQYFPRSKDTATPSFLDRPMNAAQTHRPLAARTTTLCWILLSFALIHNRVAGQEVDAGSIRGSVQDGDFESALPSVNILLLELDLKVINGDDGNYLISDIAPGTYTLIFSKAGYVRQVKTEVLVLSGELTEADMLMYGDFTDMEEFLVQDLLGMGEGSEGLLLELRLESPALMDSVSSELLRAAGASDAAGALTLISGATVKDGKSAVIRGLPDRYISTQLNGIRLPSADEDKRAVELDQFPSAVIDSVRVTKTFTPDQMGDASGGAVDIRLKGIPDEAIFKLQSEFGFNSNTGGRKDFLTYAGGGVSPLGRDAGRRDIQDDLIGESWGGAVGVSEAAAPLDFKWSAALGGSHTLENGLRVGGFANFFYDRDNSYIDDRTDDSYWVDQPGEGLTPEYSQGAPEQGQFFTSLFDIRQGTQSVQWGTMGSVGIESENHSLSLNYLSSHSTEDVATLAEDTRGKSYFFEDYDPNDPLHEGNEKNNLGAAPFVRFETLSYTERTTDSIQLHGNHILGFNGFDLGGYVAFDAPEFSWSLAHSTADQYQPDKRQFGSYFLPSAFTPGVPPFTEDSYSDESWEQYKPSDNINIGNLQRIWKTIEETSDQRRFDLILPFKQWGKQEGYLKVGLFDDAVKRKFNQDTFSNGGEGSTNFVGGFNEFWSGSWEDEDHPIEESLYDVDYRATQDVSAWYLMTDLPLTSYLNLVGGVRYESTEISVKNSPEELAFWFPSGATAPVSLAGDPDAANVDFNQSDSLPALTLIAKATENLSFHASYSETIARQTFKELTPILQQEFLGGPIFIGDPGLRMSALKNYDLRADYTPYAGGLLSASYFKKKIEDPIEYVQRLAGFTFTTPVNYPEGVISGLELELRQDMSALYDSLAGLNIGVNATFINSEVTLPADEAALFSLPGVAAPRNSRDMVNAPERLFNAFFRYDFFPTDTQLGVFYTIQGDTLVAGAGVSDSNFVPDIYANRHDSLNMTLSQGIGKYFTLTFKAKNLTNPTIEEVFRSPYIGADVRNTSYSKGIDYSISLTAEILF